MFTPVAPQIKEKIIELHLAGFGRNAIDRQLKIEGVMVSHGSISNTITRYKKEQAQSYDSSTDVISSSHSDIESINKSDRVTTSPEETLAERTFKKSENHVLTQTQQQNDYPHEGKNLGYVGPLGWFIGVGDQNDYDATPSKAGNPKNEDEFRTDSAGGGINIELPMINQYVEEDGFIEEAELEQHRFTETLSDTQITSGPTSYNRNQDQDQDQQEETIDWAERQSSVTEASDRRPAKSIIDLDSDEIMEKGVIHFINTDREQRRREIQLIKQGWQELENERHRVEQMKQSIEQRENNLKVRKINIADVEHLAPSIRQLQEIGATFEMIQNYIWLVNERSFLGNIDSRQAAIFILSEFRELKNLGGILKEKQKAKKELSELNMLITQKQQEVTTFSGGNGNNKNGYALSDYNYIRLNLLKQNNNNMLNRMVH